MLFIAAKTFRGILFHVLNSPFNTSEGPIEMTYIQQVSNVRISRVSIRLLLSSTYS